MVDFTQQSPSNQLSNKVETQVRALIGDLQMQLIVMRSMLEMAQAQQQEQEQQPQQPQQQPPQQPMPSPQQPPANAKANGVRPIHEIKQ